MILESILGLNPDIGKPKFLTHIYTEKIILCEDRPLSSVNSKYSVYSVSISDVIKQKILGYFQRKVFSTNISNEVLLNGNKFIDLLYPSMIEKLGDSVYSTNYGTLVFDWEIDGDNIFSVEVGAKRFGYFIEMDGTDVKQIDSETLTDYSSTFLEDLSQFLA